MKKCDIYILIRVTAIKVSYLKSNEFSPQSNTEYHGVLFF